MDRFPLPSSQSLSLYTHIHTYTHTHIYIYHLSFRSLRYFTHYSGPQVVPDFLLRLLSLDPRYGATGCSERMCSSDSKSCFLVSRATLRETFFRFWNKFRGGVEHTRGSRAHRDHEKKFRELLGPGYVPMLEERNRREM
jgi:hypothetical protein